MAKVLVYTRADGGVTISHPLIGLDDPPDFTEDDAIERARNDIPPDASDIEVVEKITLPTDRVFRNAWTRTVGGGPVSLDLPKARDVHRGRIAGAIDLEIARLAIEERKLRLEGNATAADAAAADKASIEALNLATLATQIGAAANITALKAVWPAKVPK